MFAPSVGAIFGGVTLLPEKSLWLAILLRDMISKEPRDSCHGMGLVVWFLVLRTKEKLSLSNNGVDPEEKPVAVLASLFGKPGPQNSRAVQGSWQ